MTYLIYLLVTRRHRSAFDLFLASWGKELASRVKVVPYERLFRADKTPAGSYVFSGLELLSPEQLTLAATCWTALSSSGHELHLLNNPLRVKRRFELLRELYERGINDFDVYRLTEARNPRRFPVFIRGENDHAGAETGLVHTQQELDAAINALVAAGKPRDTRIVTEFNASVSRGRLYRKYGAFVLGGRIIPRHLIYNSNWVVKGAGRFVDDQIVAEEWDYVQTNPHEDRLREIFAIAQIDYGRIDSDVVDGRIQVFEINTNPQILTPGGSRDATRTKIKRAFAERFTSALSALDCDAPPSPIAVNFERKPLLKRRPPIVDILLSMCRWIGLAKYEAVIHMHLLRWRSTWR